MKWFLLVMMLKGGIVAVPMDSEQSCHKAQAQVSAVVAYTACVQSGE